MNDEWEAISGHCPPSSAILDHLPYKSCWEVDIRSRRLLEANGSKWQPLEGINDYWGPSWVYWDWFLLEQLGAINVRACLPGSRHIVRQWACTGKHWHGKNSGQCRLCEPTHSYKAKVIQVLRKVTLLYLRSYETKWSFLDSIGSLV